MNPMFKTWWNALPVLLAASLPWAAGTLALTGLAVAGAVLLVPLAGLVLLGPAWMLVARVAASSVHGGPPRPGEVVRAGTVRALPVFVPAQLTVVTLEMLGGDAPAWAYGSLAANLVVLGGALIVAPFAFAARADLDVLHAWRLGAGVAAALPRPVCGGAAFVVLAGVLAVLLGPPLLIVVPGVLAVGAATVTKEALVA